MHFSYRDAYLLPVWKRRWFLNKFIEEQENQRDNRSNRIQNTDPSSNNSTKSSKRIFSK